ncbi:hypothetical protein X975_04270, partial [Stegodyphus mimosarum]
MSLIYVRWNRPEEVIIFFFVAQSWTCGLVTHLRYAE